MTKQQKDLCTQRRLRSATASAQSDQSLHCALWQAKDPSRFQVNIEDWSESLLGTYVILLVWSALAHLKTEKENHSS